MADSRAPSLFNGSKLSPTLKFVALVAAAMASAFGTVQIAPNNQAAQSAQSAQAHAVRADEKVDLAYQLLGQKVDYENRALNTRIDDFDRRLQRIERKLDGLARGESRPARGPHRIDPLAGGLAAEGAGDEEEAAPAEPPPVASPKPSPSEQRVALPSSLDAAYRSKKAGYGTGL